MLLVKFQENYADEFDLSGWAIMEHDDWDDIKSKITNHSKWPVMYYFGWNEYLEWDCAAQLLDCYLAKEITEDDADLIERIFGDDGGGEFPYPWESWDD